MPTYASLGPVPALPSMEPLTQNEPGRIEQNAGFTTTLWTVVLHAGQADSPHASAALEKLCCSYWYPLYAFVRRQGYDPDQAQDLTQAFFCRVLEKNYLRAADPNRGRFRSFLLTSLKHFLADEWDHSQRQKRGGGAKIFSLDAEGAERRYLLEPVDPRTPEKDYLRHWAEELVERVMTRLQGEYVREGKADRFEAFKAFLVGDDPASQAEVGARLGMSESAVKSAMFRMRQRYAELFRDEIAQTVASQEEVEEELRELFAALAG
jgi:RNA polymerase sigma factor (sigma-70 family)